MRPRPPSHTFTLCPHIWNILNESPNKPSLELPSRSHRAGRNLALTSSAWHPCSHLPSSHLPTAVISHTICLPIEHSGDPVPALNAPFGSSTATRTTFHLQTLPTAINAEVPRLCSLFEPHPHPPPTNCMATPYAYEPVCTPHNMREPRSFPPLQVQPLHWSINALYNIAPFPGPMDSYDYLSATTNFPSKSCAPHYTQSQPQPQYCQPPATQDVNLFDVNAFAALSPSSVGSHTITPSFSPSTIPLPTDTFENVYMRQSHPIPPPPASFEGPATGPPATLPATIPANRGVRRRRQQEDEEIVEGLLPPTKRRRCERSNSSVALPSVPPVPGVLSATPAVTAQSLDVDISLVDEQTTSWAPSVRKRRPAKRLDEVPPSTATHSVTRASIAPLPDTKYGWLDHLLGSALEGNKRS